jgi:hypothetical protein
MLSMGEGISPWWFEHLAPLENDMMYGETSLRTGWDLLRYVDQV